MCRRSGESKGFLPLSLPHPMRKNASNADARKIINRPDLLRIIIVLSMHVPHILVAIYVRAQFWRRQEENVFPPSHWSTPRRQLSPSRLIMIIPHENNLAYTS
jgi:hypothetical protein